MELPAVGSDSYHQRLEKTVQWASVLLIFIGASWLAFFFSNFLYLLPSVLFMVIIYSLQHFRRIKIQRVNVWMAWYLMLYFLV
ncbi:MAG: hypothetical protein Q8N36_04360, partial [bacterium]|nr:hypothetical protein [bacterium]